MSKRARSWRTRVSDEMLKSQPVEFRWRSFTICFAVGAALLTTRAARGDTPDPQLAFWLSIKEELTGVDSDAYWEALQEAFIPGGMNGVKTLRGSVASSNPPERPNEIRVIMSGTAAEVTLRLVDEHDAR